MSLDDLRKSIDEIDDQILALLSQRGDVVAEIARAKQAEARPTYDPERERQVLDRLSERGAGRFPRSAVRAVFREVMSASLSLQAPLRVAYLGPEGTFSHMAAREMFGLAARYVEAVSLPGVFDAVARGDAAFGVVPIENSTEGSVTHATDALIEGDLRIRAELVLPVSHCLLSHAAGLSSVTRIYSHPQALAQCRAWLADNVGGAQLLPSTSTSAAVREAAGDPQGAAIASRLAGDLHGVPVLRERIQDREDNATRFVMIAKEDAPRTGDDRTTIAFSLRDEPRALRGVLDRLGQEGINLTRIESRPSQKKAWDYVFLVDVEGHRDDEAIGRAMDALRGPCPLVKVIGSYPRHRIPEPRGIST